MRRTLVLGLGNTLLADEGVGVHVIRRLAAESSKSPEAEFLDGGTLGIALAAVIGDTSQLIVIDASELNGPPGAVRLYEGEAMDGFLGGNRKRSVHEVSLLDVMTAARLMDRLPGRRALIAIQPQRVDWGEALTDAVARAVPEACAMVTSLVRRWRQ